jgi:hypothetical protein
VSCVVCCVYVVCCVLCVVCCVCVCVCVCVYVLGGYGAVRTYSRVGRGMTNEWRLGGIGLVT